MSRGPLKWGRLRRTRVRGAPKGTALVVRTQETETCSNGSFACIVCKLRGATLLCNGRCCPGASILPASPEPKAG